MEDNIINDDFQSKSDLCLLNYDVACKDIANLFCEKHEFEKLGTKDTFWIVDDVGGILFCSDYYFGMKTILTDLKTNVPEEKLMEYYNYCLDNELYDYDFKTYLKHFKNTGNEQE
jgi:hypothetical protein